MAGESCKRNNSDPDEIQEVDRTDDRKIRPCRVVGIKSSWYVQGLVIACRRVCIGSAELLATGIRLCRAQSLGVLFLSTSKPLSFVLGCVAKVMPRRLESVSKTRG